MAVFQNRPKWFHPAVHVLTSDDTCLSLLLFGNTCHVFKLIFCNVEVSKWSGKVAHSKTSKGHFEKLPMYNCTSSRTINQNSRDEDYGSRSNFGYTRSGTIVHISPRTVLSFSKQDKIVRTYIW